MTRELILHLGDCKTGSTAVQTCLAQGTHGLGPGQIFYPAPPHHNTLALSVGGVRDEAADHAPHLAERFTRIARALEASDAQWGVISAELFEFVEPGALAAALDRFLPGYAGRTRLVAYVRPHHARLVSAYAETVKKTGGPASLEIFADRWLAQDRMAFHPRFAAWRDRFGAAFTLRPFLRDRLAGGDVVSDFLAFVTGNDRIRVPGETQRNASLSLPNLAMLRLAHEQLGASGLLDAPALALARRQLGWHMAPLLGRHSPPGAPRVQADRALAERLRAACAADARAMDADFFEGAPMARALEAAPDLACAAPQSLEPEDHFDAVTIGIIRGWADFTARIIAADPAHFRQAASTAEDRHAARAARKARPGGTLLRTLRRRVSSRP